MTNKSLLMDGSNRLQVIEVTSCSISINSINSPSDPLKYGEYLYIFPPGETNIMERLTPSTIIIYYRYYSKIIYIDKINNIYTKSELKIKKYSRQKYIIYIYNLLIFFCNLRIIFIYFCSKYYFLIIYVISSIYYVI